MKDFFATKKGILVLNILKYIIFFCCLYLFFIGGIRNQIFPFAFAFFVALCWCDQNVFVMSFLFVLAGIFANFGIQSFVECASTAIIIIACYFFHKKIKTRIPSFLIAIYALLSQTMYMYYHLISINAIVPTFVYLILGILFMYCCIKIFKILLVKGIGLKLTIDECICLSVFFMAMGAGLSSLNLYGFSSINIVAVFFILLATFTFNSSSVSLIVGASFGLGSAIQTGSLATLSCLVCIALCSVCFKSTSKYFSIMAIIICDVVLGLYFNAYGIYNYKILVSTIVGELLFLCISNGSLTLLQALFSEHNSTTALRDMVNRSKDNLCKRMFSLSEVFDEMDRAFKSSIKGILPASEAKQMLKDELLQKVCSDCPEKHRCQRVLERETSETLDAIVSAGLDRGKVTLLDIPPFLSTRCNRTNTIINILNSLLASYKQYTYCASNIDTSKALIAEEFSGVSKLLLQLSNEAKELLTFNENLEEKIAEDLNYINVLCTEVYVYQKDDKMFSCLLTLRQNDLQNYKLQTIIDKNFGQKMMIQTTEPASAPNFVIATFCPAPKYQCIFGTSGTAKFGGTVSGDSYTFVRLSGNKILLSVCDGMGSGDEAQKTSDTTISLIENFYRANFDDDIVLSSVNKLLSMEMSDNYSALDICVIDLMNALGDFVKVGSPASFIKHKDSTDVLEGSGALPIGILQEIKPSINKKLLTSNDMVVLLSDGIIDAFGEIEKLQAYINNISTNNPQELTDQILSQAIALSSGEPKDDMTALCARIYVNV